MDFDYWVCPDCGYVITDTELQLLKADYGCPRCKRSLGDFLAVPTSEKEVSDD